MIQSDDHPVSSSWGRFPLPGKDNLHWRLGKLAVWVSKHDDEWHLAHKFVDSPDEVTHAHLAPEDGNLCRYVFPEKGIESGHFIMRPGFPDRSVVSRPTMPLELLSGATVRIFCGIPVWVEVCLDRGGKLDPVVVLPLKKLSRTWFGTPQQGEACYASETRAVRDPANFSANFERIICPVELRNHCPEPLRVDRLCIRTRHLSIYRSKSRCWSNEFVVTKRTKGGTSRVTFRKIAPEFEPDCKFVTPPREDPDPSGLFLKTFQSLRGFVNYARDDG